MVEQVYRPRRPKKSPLWQCLCAHFYDFIQAYPEKYEKKYGFLKPVVEDVVNNYLDCGDLSKGFARIYCENCKKSMLLPFSCKGRWFCPSCHEKKVLLFGEFITGTIAFPVPHRQYVFSLPIMWKAPPQLRSVPRGPDACLGQPRGRVSVTSRIFFDVIWLPRALTPFTAILDTSYSCSRILSLLTFLYFT